MTITKVQFTSILDTVYNLGDVDILGTYENLPQEIKSLWDFYHGFIVGLDLEKQGFEAIVWKALENDLVDKDSAFFTEWKHDMFENLAFDETVYENL